MPVSKAHSCPAPGNEVTGSRLWSSNPVLGDPMVEWSAVLTGDSQMATGTWAVRERLIHRRSRGRYVPTVSV